MEAKLKEIVCNAIDKRKKDLNKISQEIWKKPELGSKEYFAHDLLTRFLEDEGFNVQKKYPLETSFVAKYGSTKNDSIKIGIICEYDALPVIGHACGHNLIAEVGIAAAIGIKAVLSKIDENDVCIIIYGTPDEEGDIGKVKMIKNGVFDDVDICMMSHPFPDNIATPKWLALDTISIVYTGKSSHAAAAPLEGINALDAAVSCYNNISMLRQQTKPTDRINMIISHGGDKPNIIPERAELKLNIRGLTDFNVNHLKTKVIECANGAAKATGCRVEVIYSDLPSLSALDTNKELINLYINNAKTLGITFDESFSDGAASTDMGNVSKIKPSIHPLFKIKTDGPNHTKEFTIASGSIENQIYALNSAKSIAMTAVDIICNPELLKDIQKCFQDS